MHKKVKFHNIFYRYVLFVLALVLMMIYVIGEKDIISVKIFDYTLAMDMKQLIYVQVVSFAILSLIFYRLTWKFYVCKEGIYLKKIDLLVIWDEISAVSHVWINEYKALRLVGNPWFYNQKTLVIYRKNYKPICIYNISVLSLYAVKLCNPKIKTNIFSATFATWFNLVVNGAIFYCGYAGYFKDLKIEIFVTWAILYTIKVFVVPLVMVAYRNLIHGKSLFHSTIYSVNASKAIHL